MATPGPMIVIKVEISYEILLICFTETAIKIPRDKRSRSSGQPQTVIDGRTSILVMLQAAARCRHLFGRVWDP
jgi:hypothetical protein